MIHHWLLNPHTSLAKWLKLSLIKQNVILILFGFILVSMPLFEYVQYQHYAQQLTQDIQQTKQQIEQKYQQLNQLQQNTQQQLNPELAREIVMVNQQIQNSLGHHLQLIHNKWDFQPIPHLQLQLQSKFADFQLFLTALLQQNIQLHLTHLSIQQIENEFSHKMIEADLSIIFQPIKDKK